MNSCVLRLFARIRYATEFPFKWTDRPLDSEHARMRQLENRRAEIYYILYWRILKNLSTHSSCG
jgi:hypothetical protein